MIDILLIKALISYQGKKIKLLNKTNYSQYKNYPEKIIQFGEGNFLRAFCDWMMSEANNKTDFGGSIVVTNATKRGSVEKLNNQNGLFTLFIQGINNEVLQDESIIVNSISRGINPYTHYDDFLEVGKQEHLRFAISNTTEAGIYFDENDTSYKQSPNSFPAKLTALLYIRYTYFKGDIQRGLIILPCELIEDNGARLKEVILKYASLWNLENDFVVWVNEANIFCDTLVDRIVPGYPKDEKYSAQLDYTDKAMVVAEPYHLWVIKSPKPFSDEFPLQQAGLNVVFADDLAPYRTRKVRILNGLHTAMVPVAYLSGITTVGEAIANPEIAQFINLAASEIISTLAEPEEELRIYLYEVLSRFKNPYIVHNLMSIALNSFTKFNTRVMPSIQEYYRINNHYPDFLIFSLAGLIVFYRGIYADKTISLTDNQQTLDVLFNCWNSNFTSSEIAKIVLSQKNIWETDLSQNVELVAKTAQCIDSIQNDGMLQALKSIVKKVI